MYMQYFITKLTVPSSFYFYYKTLLKVVRYFGVLLEYYIFQYSWVLKNLPVLSTPLQDSGAPLVLPVLGTLLHST